MPSAPDESGRNALGILFKAYDADLSGRIDYGEFGKLCAALNIPLEDGLEAEFRRVARFNQGDLVHAVDSKANCEEDTDVSFDDFCRWYDDFPEERRRLVAKTAKEISANASIFAALSAPAVQTMGTFLMSPLALFRQNVAVGAFDTILSDQRWEKYGGYVPAFRAFFAQEGLRGIMLHGAGVGLNAGLGVLMWSTYNLGRRAIPWDHGSADPVAGVVKEGIVAGAAAGCVQGVLSTPIQAATLRFPNEPVLRVLWRAASSRRLRVQLWEYPLLACSKNALGMAAFFGSYDGSRIALARYMHLMEGQRLHCSEVAVGDVVVHDLDGPGVVTDKSEHNRWVRVRFDKGGNVMKYRECRQGLVGLSREGSQQYRRRFIDRFGAPLAAGTLAGTAFIAIAHPFDQLRVWHAVQPAAERGPSALRDFIRARASPTLLLRGLSWKLPQAVMMGVPLFVYSFTMYS